LLALKSRIGNPSARNASMFGLSMLFSYAPIAVGCNTQLAPLEQSIATMRPLLSSMVVVNW